MKRKPLTKVRLGERGPIISRLCLSGLPFALDMEECEAGKIIASFQEAGGNFIDVAGAFGDGRSERIVGRALRTLQGNWTVATGMSLAQNSGIASSKLASKRLWNNVEQSLERLGLDSVDIYYLRFGYEIANLEQTVEELGELIEAGMIKSWGFSNLPAWKIAELIGIADCLDIPRPIATQPYYHALYRQAEKDYLPACSHFRIGVVTCAPLARWLQSGDQLAEFPLVLQNDIPLIEAGSRPAAQNAINAITDYLRSSGREIMKFAVQWVLANRLVSSVLVRPRSAEELEVYLSAAEMPYTLNDEAFVDQLVPSGHTIGSAYRDPNSARGGRVVI